MSGETLRAAELRLVADRTRLMADAARDHPLQLVEVSRQMFEDLVVRPLAALASAPVQTGTGAWAWRTKTSIRDGSPSGRFVVDWEEAEAALSQTGTGDRFDTLPDEHLERDYPGISGTGDEIDVPRLARALVQADADLRVGDDTTNEQYAAILAVAYRDAGAS